MELVTEIGKMSEKKGFTLIEIIIVLGIIGILVSIAVPQYKSSVLRAKEAVLRENLFIIRKLIDQYYQDKGKYPASLQALVQDGYLKSIPVDPITRSTETWLQIPEIFSPEEGFASEPTGIVDVKSGARGKSPFDKTEYSSW